MASPANNNSSFSPPIPNRPNPKPRNSESGDPLRRSFGGNPFPTNSRVNLSSDLSRRNSFGGRDKENEIKAIPTPKGSKNFMSPTISAVSKINASPRKKVLSDKNELSRSDVKGLILEENTKQSNQLSCSEDGKGLILEDTKRSHQRSRSCVSFSDVMITNIICIDEKNRFEEESHDMTVTDFGEVEVVENKGIVYSDPRFRISPRPSVQYTSPEFVGRETGPLLPPYDPKRNYLSPRPQFLHYKPNPRVEERFGECKQLDGLFVSESFSSDTEVSTEEEEVTKDAEQLEVESDEEMVSQSIEETEDAYLKGGAEAVEEEETEDTEQLEVESDEELVCESIEGTSQVTKQSGFRKLRFLGWFLALALGCMLVSATFSPPTGSPFYEFYIPREISEFAKANNLEKLSDKLWTLTEVSLVYMDKMISSLGGREEEYGPLRFHNLTYTLEVYTVFQPTSVEISVAEEPLQEKSLGETNLEDGYVSEFEEQSAEEENSEVVCETKDGDAETEMKPGTDIELNEGEGNSEALLVDSVERNTEEQEQSKSELNPEEPQEMLVAVSTEKLEDFESEAIYVDEHNVESDASINVNHKESEVAGVESEAIYINQHDVESDASSINVDLLQKENEAADVASGSETSKSDNDLSKAMIVLSLAVLVLLGVAAFIFAKKVKTVSASAPGPVVPETIVALNTGHVMKEKLSSQSFEVDEEVDDRTSSSFHKKSSSQSKSRGGMMSRRESMATSASEYSIGSFSYGSFTTYEKIPIKSGDREEEMITPVRRSSRLRNNNQSSGL